MKRAVLLSTLIATGLMLAPAAFAQDKNGAMSPMAPHDNKMSDGMKPANSMTKSDDNKMQKSDAMSKTDGMKDTTKTNNNMSNTK